MTAVLAAQPGVHRVPAKAVELYFKKDFLTPEVCAGLVERIDAGRRPSTIADDYGIPGFRTSETCDLDGADPLVAEVKTQICALTGLDSAHGEPMQGQRYAVGQEFKLHTDYFEPGGADFQEFCGLTGQRTWTAMIFLNEPDDGGATRFKRIDRIIKPETGKLLAWNNLDAAGAVNPWTLHAGMKVRAGTKYVITQWFRERAWPAA